MKAMGQTNIMPMRKMWVICPPVESIFIAYLDFLVVGITIPLPANICEFQIIIFETDNIVFLRIKGMWISNFKEVIFTWNCFYACFMRE